MQPQILDESIRFTCGSCTSCCDQPWHTLIEPDKAAALDRHDFGAYPQLVGKKFYETYSLDKKGRHRLAKGEGTKCLFLDADGLCIIHKELGAEAKPGMCRQFPFLSSSTRVDDRISVNFGCPSVQSQKGERLVDQADDVTPLVPRTQREAMPDSPTPLIDKCMITPDENDALTGRAMSLFDTHREADMWTRFAELLVTLAAVYDYKTDQISGDQNRPALADLLRAGEPLPGTPDLPDVRAYPQPDQSPMQARMLFAATLYPDAIPPDTMSAMSFIKRLTLIPKLMAMATLKGAYVSRVLNRNIAIEAVMEHPVERELDAAGTQLLARYFRSRLWQRQMIGTRLGVIAGVHQHIQDFNAIIFLARAEALHTNSAHLTEPIIRKALTAVEFHLANQDRLFNQALKGWFRTQLQRPALALASLRLMAVKPPDRVEPAPHNSDRATV